MTDTITTTKPGVLAVMDRDRNDAACNRFEAANVSGQTPADRLREYEESREARATVERLAATLDAAMAFIESHVADPDITNEMAEKYAALQALNPPEVIAAFRGDV